MFKVTEVPGTQLLIYSVDATYRRKLVGIILNNKSNLYDVELAVFQSADSDFYSNLQGGRQRRRNRRKVVIDFVQ